MKALLDDELWELIEAVLPQPKRRRFRYPGRRPLSNRQCLTGILYVLRTGIPWEYLPQEMGCGSGMSCWRRLHRWQRAGVWKKLHRLLLNHLRESEQIDGSRALVDRSSVRAVFGGGAAGSQAVAPIAGKVGHPRQRPDKLQGDRAFIQLGCILICWNFLNHSFC
jgi:transposase